MKTLVILLGLITTSASAQVVHGTWPPGGGVLFQAYSDADTRPKHALTGDAALDHAVAICDAHMTLHHFMEGDQWAYDFNECQSTIIPAWYDSKTEKDRREAEQQAKEHDDKAWLEQYAKTLNRK
jgi:hypothetical protein